MRSSLGLTLAILGAVAACGPQIAIDEDVDTSGGVQGSSDDASAPSPSGPGLPPSTSGPPPGTSVGEVDVDDGSSAESLGFIPDPTDSCGIAPEGTSFHCTKIECDPFLQDCPEGEKCMPWANDGGQVWNSFRCAPVAANPGQVGESCEVEGSAVSGIDDCDTGLMCFWVDAATNEGTCVPWCEGSAGNPMCAEGSSCVQSASTVLSLCMDTCDPITDDCPSGHCLPTYEGFTCAGIELGEGAPGSACEFVNDCAAGTTCLTAETVGDCEGASCCTSWCDLEAADPSALCLPGQSCLAWWNRGEAPESWAHVGVCGVPS